MKCINNNFKKIEQKKKCQIFCRQLQYALTSPLSVAFTILQDVFLFLLDKVPFLAKVLIVSGLGGAIEYFTAQLGL